MSQIWNKLNLKRNNVFYIIFAASLILGAHFVFYIYLLNSKTIDVVNNFKKLSTAEIASNDIYNLAVKLNYLSSDINYICISLKKNDDIIYKIKCNSQKIPSVFAKNIHMKLNENLSLEVTTKLSFIDSTFIIISCLIQLILITLIQINNLRFQRNNLENKAKVEKAFHQMEVDQLNRTVKIAHQVAHDINSPVIALTHVINDINDLNTENGRIARHAVNRIKEISDDLLLKYKKIGELEEKPNAQKSFSITDALRSIIDEKKVGLDSHKISLVLDFDPVSSLSFSNINESILKRAISNLINNSIESIADKGKITISAVQEGLYTKISIVDTGKGIPSNILPVILNKGGSFDKKNGNGIGVHHAKNFIESSGGTFDILSTQGEGTTVHITVPTVSQKIATNDKIVLLDDVELVHLLWKKKAKDAGKEIRCFKTLDDLRIGLCDFSKETQFFIDSDLGNGLSGETALKELNEKGFTNLYLTTGFDPNLFAHLDFIKAVIGKTPPF